MTVAADSGTVAINIFTVCADAAEHGWKVLSEQYKNLKTPMLFQCPKGHQVEITYDDWRKTHNCAECNKSVIKSIERNKILPKKSESDYRVLALDGATGTTGWAIFDNNKLTSYGTFDTIYSEDAAQRIHQVKEWLITNLAIWQPDAVGVENIQLQKNVQMFQTLANLQGVVVDTLISLGYKYMLGYSTTWRTYCGLNNADDRSVAKKKAQDWVKTMYGVSPTQDEADAICMGRYFNSEFSKTKNKSKIKWGEDIL